MALLVTGDMPKICSGPTSEEFLIRFVTWVESCVSPSMAVILREILLCYLMARLSVLIVGSVLIFV